MDLTFLYISRGEVIVKFFFFSLSFSNLLKKKNRFRIKILFYNEKFDAYCGFYNLFFLNKRMENGQHATPTIGQIKLKF